MGKITFITPTPRKGTLIVRQNFTVTVEESQGQGKPRAKVKKLCQYADTFDSIFVDEQIKANGQIRPTPTHVYIVKGKLTVDEDNAPLEKFMTIHPDNEANGGKEFRLLDVEGEDLFEVKKWKLTTKVQNDIMNADESLAISIGVWFFGIKYLNLSVNKVKLALTQKAGREFKFVEEVNAFINEKSSDEKLVATLALTENIITLVDGKKIAWFTDSGNVGDVMYIGTQADDVIRDFSIWLKTDEEGRQVLGLISDKLSKLKKQK